MIQGRGAAGPAAREGDMMRAPMGRRLATTAALALAAVAAAGCSRTSRMDARCIAGDVAVCTELGDMYATGRGVPRDLGQAARAYDRACSGGATDVCATLGEIVEQADSAEGGLPRAEQLYAKACGGGSSRGCLDLGRVAALRGDLSQAVSLYERSCSGGWAPGCYDLAVSYRNGDGVAKDLPKALALYQEACDAEHAESCIAAGDLYLGEDPPVAHDLAAATRMYGRALDIYKQACDAGSQPDCTEQDRMRSRLALIRAGKELTVK